MNLYFKLLLPVLFYSGIILSAHAQSQSFIYADVILKNKEVVTGVIKWSNGQMLWTDVLKVSKSNSLALKYLSKYELNKLPGQEKGKSLDWQFMDLWKDKLPERKKEVLCRFGDIASIHIVGRLDAQVFCKNGSKIRVRAEEGDKNFGEEITVYSSKARKIAWDQISKIVFKTTGRAVLPWKGEPLYGTIYTTNGALTGFIKWDKTKFITSEAIHGKKGSDNFKANFSQIKSIAKKDKGVLLTLSSNKKVFLQGNRDVNAFNRGIVVMDPEWGRMLVEWGAFKSVVFHDQETAQINYNTFVSPKKIYAKVFSKDQKVYKGNCTFDMDEEWDFELLEGNSNHIHYQIPFSGVSSIIPQNEKQSKVYFKNGKTLMLGEQNDVMEKNWGLIIWMANSTYRYLSWDQIGRLYIR